MKKKIFCIVGIVVLICIICLSIIRRNNRLKPIVEVTPENEKDIVLEIAYKNYAWSFQYTGDFVTKDGCIYSFNLSEDSNLSGIDSYEKIQEYKMKNATLKDEKISDEDMKVIMQNAMTLEDKIETKNVMMDAGSNYIEVFKDANDRGIIIYETGDSYGENKTEESKAIQKILKKYFKNEIQ